MMRNDNAAATGAAIRPMARSLSSARRCVLDLLDGAVFLRGLVRRFVVGLHDGVLQPLPARQPGRIASGTALLGRGHRGRLTPGYENGLIPPYNGL